MKIFSCSFARNVRFLSTAAKGKVGFIGLGNMGAHMARNLIKAGHELVVYDANAEVVKKFASSTSAKAASSIAALGDCGTVITMLPSSPHVRDVYTSRDQGGLLKHVGSGALLIDSSTIDPQTARHVAKQAEESRKNFRIVDAPVSGGVGGAEAGTLTFMVGGPVNWFDDAKAYLSKMGKNIVHCGGPGAGQVAKVCNNMVLAISMIGVSEAMNIGIKLGMDPKVLAGIFNSSSARCWSSDTYNPVPNVLPNVPASRGYAGGFGVDLMKKDLGLALEAAKAADASIPLGELSHRVYSAISKAGHGLKDFSYVYEHLRLLRESHDDDDDDGVILQPQQSRKGGSQGGVKVERHDDHDDDGVSHNVEKRHKQK